ncbi:MAG: VOC family protein [Vulcanimicrobiota bacterium]
MKVLPYLCFEGRAQEAIDFYQKVLGAEVTMLMRGKDAPEGACAGGNPREYADKIMHAELKLGDDRLHVSDGMNTGQAEFKGITLSVALSTDDEARKKFAALSEGGEVRMALSETFFASSFGICNDKFGVPWMVLVPSHVPA